MAIYETRQVSAAAERLFLTQPTVSYQLSRLRSLVGDPLFTRTSRGMEPTKVCEMLYAEFGPAVSRIDSAVEAIQHFTPSTSERLFRVAMSEAGEAVFLADVLARVRNEAPRVSLEIVQRPTSELAALLASGQVDVVVGGHLGQLTPGNKSAILYKDRYACLHGIQAGWKKTVTRRQYLDANHIDIVSPFTWHSSVDALIRTAGIARRIAVQVPHFISLANVIAQSDLIATLPSTLAVQLCAGRTDLYVTPLPFSLPEFEVGIFWYERHETNGAIRWLQEIMREQLSGIRV